MGLLDRLMRRSVDTAVKMQPRRIERTVNEHLYAAPQARDEVAGLAEAARMLQDAGLNPGRLAEVAVRRSDTRVSITEVRADLAAVDNRALESVDIDASERPSVWGIRAGAHAAAWGFGAHLLHLADAGRPVRPMSQELAELAGPIHVLSWGERAELGISVFVGHGVLATGADPKTAVAAMEAAEALARMTTLDTTVPEEKP